VRYNILSALVFAGNALGAAHPAASSHSSALNRKFTAVER
jgi:hypothetical protein